MAQPTNLFPQPFADSGDKNIIPVSSATSGAATLPAGFPPITSLPLEAGGVAPTRQDFNGVLYMLSAIACWTQAGGLWTYSATTNYEPPSFVSQNGALYWCKAANGPSGTVKAPASDTAGTYWVMLMDASGMLNTSLLNIATPSTYGTVKASTTAAAGVAPLGDSNGALSGWAATESKVGATRLATSAETQTGTAATIAVTPAGLTSRTATADRSGIIEIATTAETATGTDATRAVSPAGLKGSLSTLVPPATATTYGTVKASTTIAANTVPLATSSGTLDPSWSSYQLSDTAPIVAGTAAAGTGTTVSRSDHVHPAQVDITGNAATATTAQTAYRLSASSNSVQVGSIELVPTTTAGNGGTIDFHYNGSSSDYTSRIIEDDLGQITIDGSLQVLDDCTISFPKHLYVRHVDGSQSGDLLLNYNNPTRNVYFCSDYYCISNGGANYNGTAAAAAKLTTARAINGVNFDGTANISINSCPNRFTVGTAEEGTGEGGEILLTAGASGPQIIIDNNQGTFRVFPAIPTPLVAQLNLSGPGGWNCNAPMPTTSAGVGQVVAVQGTTVVPAGGTWLYIGFASNLNNSTIILNYVRCEFVAGGSTISEGEAHKSPMGWLYKVA